MKQFVTISEEGEKWLKKGQMWMYKNNVVDLDETIENGSVVDIMTTSNEYIGTGFISQKSHILVRILTKNQNEIIDRDFFKKRICFAYEFRKTVEEEKLISGKFHFFPGDIIYGKINPQLGKYVFPRFEGLCSADAYVLNSKNGLNQKYLY